MLRRNPARRKSPRRGHGGHNAELKIRTDLMPFIKSRGRIAKHHDLHRTGLRLVPIAKVLRHVHRQICQIEVRWVVMDRQVHPRDVEPGPQVHWQRKRTRVRAIEGKRDPLAIGKGRRVSCKPRRPEVGRSIRASCLGVSRIYSSANLRRSPRLGMSLKSVRLRASRRPCQRDQGLDHEPYGLPVRPDPTPPL